MTQFRKNDFCNLNTVVFVVITLFGFALYFVPLHGASFYFDDNIAIVNNAAIKSLDIPRIFNAFNTRFLVGLSFALNYQLGGLDPVGYRLTNLLIHCLNAFLVYVLVKATLYLYAAGRKSAFCCRLEWPAFFSSLLFLSHPIQTEPVNFITQRFVLMGTFFYLLTLVLYIRYRGQAKKRYLMASLAAALAAMFCKEFVVTLPVMLAVYDFYFLADDSLWKRCRLLIPFFIIALIVPLLLLRTPMDAVGVANIADSDYVQEGNIAKVNHVDITRAYGGVGRKQYFLTELHVVCTYVRLLFFPINQNLDYDYPLSYGLDKKTVLCGIFLLCLLVLVIATYKSYRIISFSILWFFIALSVESSVIPIGHVIAEYRVYLASVGFVFLAMNVIYMRQGNLKRLTIVAAMILVIFSALAYQRNRVWRNEVVLWDDCVQKSPHKARPYYNRGFAYFNHGKLAEAMGDFSEAIKINPDYLVAYINRGIINDEEGNLLQALSDYNKAIRINPDVADVYRNRGNVYMKKNNFPQALADYNKAIAINPNYAEAYINRGSAYVMQGNFTNALSDYNKAIDKYSLIIFPTDLHRWQGRLKSVSVGNIFTRHFTGYADAYYNRGFIYDKRGDFSQALADYNEAIGIDPNYANAYNNRGFIFSRQGLYPQAIMDFTKAIEINPTIAGNYYNRGIAFSKEGNYLLAVSDFTRAVELKPDFVGVYYNRAIVYYLLGKYNEAWADVYKVHQLGGSAAPDFISALRKASGRK